uniref:Uncharacterized protein n=1 Tax=Labrus bergylta TaxID=56723 RepID=A0A3Q3NJ76_9LABR
MKNTPLTLSLHGDFQLPSTQKPIYPTVVSVRDFDPAKDAARLETAIKTKGERVQQLSQLTLKTDF